MKITVEKMKRQKPEREYPYLGCNGETLVWFRSPNSGISLTCMHGGVATCFSYWGESAFTPVVAITAYVEE